MLRLSLFTSRMPASPELNLLVPLLLISLSPRYAFAYLGAPLSIGLVIIWVILIASLLLTFYALVWFPIKRRLKRKDQREHIVSPED